MTVGDIARESVVSVGPDATASEVVETMRTEGVGSVVIEEGGRPVGIVTDRDLVMEVLAEGLDPEEVRARELTTRELVTVEAGTGVYELVRTMSEAGVRRMPVVEDGDLAGIVTMDDVIVLISMELRNIATLIRSESPTYETPATELEGF